jgi:predicted amidohydrolase
MLLCRLMNAASNQSNLMRRVAVLVSLLSACAYAVRVGVVQRMSVSELSPSATLSANAAQMATIVKTTSADLLVFPEFSLLGGVDLGRCTDAFDAYCEPLPEPGVPLCREGVTWPSAILGCATTLGPSEVTVSYNTCELLPNGTRYNTQVILHNNTIVLTYRKRHPWFTACFTTPPLEVRSFQLSNVRFGVFTCFDLLFASPKSDLRAQGITHFVYSSAIPFVGELTVKAWSFAEKVMVLSSDASPGNTAVIVNGTAVAQCSSQGEGTDCVAVVEL